VDFSNLTEGDESGPRIGRGGGGVAARGEKKHVLGAAHRFDGTPRQKPEKDLVWGER